MTMERLWRKLWSWLANKLARNILTYTASEMLNRAVPFLLLPVFTRYLEPAGYGIVATFTTLVAILEIIAGLSVHAAISVNFFKLKKEQLAVYIGNVTLILAGSTTIIVLVLQAARPLFERGLQIPEPFLSYALVIAFCQFISLVNMTLWRVEQKAAPYGIYQILQTLTNVSLSLLFVVGLKMGWQGRVYGYLAASVLFACLSVWFIVRRGYIRFQFNKDYLLDALHFGLPYVPHLLGGWLRRGIDRILIMKMLGASETGIYAAGYQVGAIIGLLATAFNRAWSPYLYEKLATPLNENGKKKLVQFAYLYFAVLIALMLGLSYSFPYVVSFVLGKAFVRSKQIVGWIALSNTFNGMYQMVVGYILFFKRTSLLAAVTFLSAVLHAILCYLLIRVNGAQGAAQASAISFGVNFLVIWFLSNRVCPMPWLLRRRKL